MGSADTPPPPAPAPPPVRATGPERARQEDEAMRRERKRYDFSKTILAGSGNTTPEGLKTTLG